MNMESKLEIRLLGIGEHPQTERLLALTEQAIHQLQLEGVVRLVQSSEIDSMVEAQLNGIPALMIGQEILCEEHIPPYESLEDLVAKSFQQWQTERAA